MDTKSAIVPADSQEQNTKAIVAYNSQTETRDTIVGKQLTPTNYKAEPVGVVINTDIVTSPFNPKKACHRLIYYTSATDFDERSEIEDPDLLITPSHTSPLNLASKEVIQATILSERPNTPYQQQHHSRSKMKAKRRADPTLQ